MKPASNFRNVLGRMAQVMVLAAGLAAILGSSGCDYGMASGLLNSFVPDFGYFPASTLYDPTGDIQSVIDYRTDVMEWVNDGWGDYILQ